MSSYAQKLLASTRLSGRTNPFATLESVNWISFGASIIVVTDIIPKVPPELNPAFGFKSAGAIGVVAAAPATPLAIVRTGAAAILFAAKTAMINSLPSIETVTALPVAPVVTGLPVYVAYPLLVVAVPVTSYLMLIVPFASKYC